MRRRASFAPALFLGAAAGEILGAVRTREAALALLDKNRLLVNAGHFAVPGESHWDAMAAWPTALIGGLFYALTLGLGGAAISYAWGRLLSPLPRPVRFLLSLATLAPGVWALAEGDRTLGIALLILALAGLWQAVGNVEENWKERLWSVAAMAVLLAGFLPWAMAGEERFTRLRDRFLLPTETGRAVNDFYYRWTLYPAEAVKPLVARTQPVAVLDPALPAETARAVAAEALVLRVMAVPEPPSGRGADFRIEYRQGKPVAVAGQIAVPWPVGDPEALKQAFSELSRQSDTSYPLRKATFYLLLGGVPLALALVLLGTARRIGAAASIAGERARIVGASIAVLLLAGGLAWAGLPSQGVERYRRLEKTAGAQEVIRAMASEDPVERLYGVIGAARHGRAAQAQLLERLDDPVLNVRYTAAASLGSAFSTEVRQHFSALLAGKKESPEFRQRLSALLAEGKQRPEFRQRLSALLAEERGWPEFRQRLPALLAEEKERSEFQQLLSALLAEEKEWSEVRKRLSALLAEEKNWYVQERVYATLWRMEWRP